MNAFSKQVSAQSESRRPDNSACSVEDEEPQRRQAIRASQQRCESAQQSNETPKEDNLPTVTQEQILSQLPPSLVEPYQISPSRKKRRTKFPPNPEADIIAKDRCADGRRNDVAYFQ